MNVFCIINIFASVFVCIFADVIGFLTLSWGNQLYITIIETAFLELLMLIFLVIEFFTIRNLEDNEYAKVDIKSNKSILRDEEEDDDAEKRRSKKANRDDEKKKFTSCKRESMRRYSRTSKILPLITKN